MARTGVLAVALTALVATPASAQLSTDTSFQALAQRQYSSSLQRGLDQAANPEFQARYAPYAEQNFTAGAENPVRPFDVDPFRLDWGATRGRELDVSITNRYGMRLHGHLSLPRSRAEEPRPAVILLPGGTGTEHVYRGIQQGLAEAGYVVLGVNAPGDAGSQATPAAEFCAPGAWQQPQEMGITELGACAGQDPPATETPEELALRVATHNADWSELDRHYQAVRARKTFAALDAAKWLLSSANPHRDEVDPGRIGIAGHSLGAHGALLAGNGDPLRRFKAVVVMDGYGLLRDTTPPRVPTLFQHSENNDYGPYREAPDPRSLPAHVDAPRFAEESIPTGVVVLGGGGHYDWHFERPALAQAPVGSNASRDGERVALHYALAWFDRYLGDGRARKASTARLTARTFDDRVDRSSIGQGPYDPITQRTVPPAIAGEAVSAHLSPFYDSWIRADRIRCVDLRGGC